MQRIIKFLTSFFNAPNNELEQFIMSKRPTSISEVEHWSKVFQSRKHWHV